MFESHLVLGVSCARSIYLCHGVLFFPMRKIMYYKVFTVSFCLKKRRGSVGQGCGGYFCRERIYLFSARNFLNVAMMSLIDSSFDNSLLQNVKKSLCIFSFSS